MNMYKIYSLAFVVALFLSACTGWVDIKTKGKLIPEETVNYRYLMNNTDNFRQTATYPDVASDDICVSDVEQQNAMYETNKFCAVYTWADVLYDQSENDTELNKLYQIIYNCNVVIDEVFDSKNGTDEEKREIYAEALVHRADAYWVLANTYGAPYRAATATTDKCVPLLTTPRVDGSLPRATVAEVFDQIIKDLTEAKGALPELPEYNFYPSQAAVYALLARTYLVMGDYDQAKTNAQEALKLQSGLLNLEDYVDGNVAYPENKNDAEVILAKMPITTFTYSPFLLVLSDDLLDLFEETDLRYQLFTTSLTDYGTTYVGRAFSKDKLYSTTQYYPTYEGHNMGPCVPEMMLIEAECLAREDDADGAMNLVNQLRQKRFKAVDYEALTAANAKDALGIVLDERRRELMCHGLRWSDQRRLANDPDFPTQTVTRVFKGTTYTLEPNSSRYVFPIGEKYLEENPEIGQIE